jgi:hypothetical protein
VQAKLRIGPVDDPLEREADRIADAVIADRSIASVAGAPSSALQRKCAACEAEEEGMVRRKESGIAPATRNGAEAAVAAVSHGGIPLTADQRAYFEPRFGRDLSRVRVHLHPRAHDAAGAIEARAYTSGMNIAFALGQFSPSSTDGRRLIAHELAHVAQQDRAQPGANASTADIWRQHEVRTQAQEEERERRKAEQAEREAREKDQREIAQIERASQRGRRFAGDKNNQIRSYLGGIEVVYRMMTKYYPFMEDSIAGVGFDPNVTDIAIVPASRNAKLQDDSAFVIKIGAKFIQSDTTAQRRSLEAALRALPSVAGQLDWAAALKEGAQVASSVEFGSTTGSLPGADEEDAYDASAWDEISRKLIRAKIEPWRAMKRLVDHATSPVPKKGGGTTIWKFDCFDAVAFAQVYARWRVMSRFQFNSIYYPLELGYLQSSQKMEWQPSITSRKPGGARYTEETRPGATASGIEVVHTNITESWSELLRTAPIGTHVTWSNLDAEARCKAAEQRRKINPGFPDPSYCESFQHENTMKLGPDTYLAHPFKIKNQAEIEAALADAVISTLDRKPPLQSYIRKNIYISKMRKPKQSP